MYKRLDNIHKVWPVASPLECNDARADRLLNHICLLRAFDQFDDHKPEERALLWRPVSHKSECANYSGPLRHHVLHGLPRDTLYAHPV